MVTIPTTPIPNPSASKVASEPVGSGKNPAPGKPSRVKEPDVQDGSKTYEEAEAKTKEKTSVESFNSFEPRTIELAASKPIRRFEPDSIVQTEPDSKVQAEPEAIEVSRRLPGKQSVAKVENHHVIESVPAEPDPLVPSRRESNPDWKQVSVETEAFRDPVQQPTSILAANERPEIDLIPPEQHDAIDSIVQKKHPKAVHTEVVPELSAAAIGATSKRAANVGAVAANPVVGAAHVATQQLVETVMKEVTQSADGSKRLTMYLHPAELGKLTIQVGWESEIVSAKIITSELATSELLNRDRNWLINSLEASGFDLTSFDVSHGGSDVERDFDEQFQQASKSRFSSSSKESKSETPIHESSTAGKIGDRGTVVNIIA